MNLIKFFHVASVFFWISSLLVLTRQLAWQGRTQALYFRRHYFFIELPFMILTVVSGLVLLFLRETNWLAPWLHMKLTFVALLIVCDLILLAQLMKHKREGAPDQLLGYKILHWTVVISFLVVLVAIYVMKPKFQ